MELRNYKFYCSGQDMSFSIFLKDLCRTKYSDNIDIPFVQLRVDVYEIEPGPQAQWILIKQKDGSKEEMRLFVRKGGNLQREKSNACQKLQTRKFCRSFPV